MLLKTNHNSIALPAFFPDATHACIKSVNSAELKKTKTDGLVINAYHLYMDNVADHISRSGGIHKFINFNNPIITDSGGFQIMSLIRRNMLKGKLTDDGPVFNTNENGKVLFSPEVSIDTQLKLQSDIVMCLDDCTDSGEPQSQQELSVERTIKWAKQCKDYFEKHKNEYSKAPLLFAIIQGGNNKLLRQKCADALRNIEFDGYAYGGWPVDEKRILMTDILKYSADLMPDDKPKYAMGVGKPEDIVNCFKMGYNMFDCVLPTRDARHERLYVFNNDYKNEILENKPFYGYIYIGSSKYKYDEDPVSQTCDCVACQKYSRAYIRHLFKCKEITAYTLATIHNLRFYSMLMEQLLILL